MYLTGIAVVFEAIVTDIIVFTVPNEAKTNSQLCYLIDD